MKLLKSLPLVALLSLPMSNTHMSPLPPGPGVAGSLAGAEDVELLVARRKPQPVRLGYLALADAQTPLPVRVTAVRPGRRLALAVADLERLPQARFEPAFRVAAPARRI